MEIHMPTLVLIRHGQSAWNLENRFTGWWDVDVTEKGAEEARAAGRLMAEKGLDFDSCFTSVQTRAIKTLHLALEEMGRLWLPVEKDWRLNERHYGGLTGLNKAETAAKHGDARSEEHTSELQSLAYLVCRLLLEKNNCLWRSREG